MEEEQKPLCIGYVLPVPEVRETDICLGGKNIQKLFTHAIPTMYAILGMITQNWNLLFRLLLFLPSATPYFIIIL